MFDDEPYQNAVLGYTERRLAARREAEAREQRRAVRNMPPVTTCDNCGLTYYQTAAPHVCAGWVGKGAMKELAGKFQQSNTAKYPASLLAELLAAGEINREQYERLRREATTATEHEPVARGGESLDDYQNAPSGIGPLAAEWRDKPHRLVYDLCRAQRSLLAEREKHTRLLEAAKLLLAMNNCNYDRDQMRRSGGFDTLNEAVEAIEPEWAKKLRGNDQKEDEG